MNPQCNNLIKTVVELVVIVKEDKITPRKNAKRMEHSKEYYLQGRGYTTLRRYVVRTRHDLQKGNVNFPIRRMFCRSCPAHKTYY